MTSTSSPQPRIAAIALLAVAAALMTAACVAWGRSVPGPGDRPLAEGFVLTMRGLSIALGAAAQAVAVALALPKLLRPHLVYRRFGIACIVLAMTAALFAGVAWVATFA